ncbi:MAG: ABC transporter ATP-binding protein [Ruminococcaceae bacterium]|nr:ABC transporter ATP-binding protein [Oscillospiraceae bacterium]
MKEEQKKPTLKEEFKAVNKKSNIIRLAAMMRPYIGQLLLCALFVLVVNAAELLKPMIAEIVIDDFLAKGIVKTENMSIAILGMIYFATIVIGSAFGIAQARLITRISQKILDTMRNKVFDKILHLSTGKLDKFGTGRLITRATNDVETVNEFYSDVFLSLFRDIFLLIGILVMMLIIDWKLALVAFTGIPFIIALTFSIKKRIKENFKKVKVTTGKINGFFSENIQGMRIVQVFNGLKEKLKEFRQLNDEYFKGTMTQVMLHSFLRPTMEMINELVIALLVAYAYNGISGGVLEVGVLYAFTNYTKQFFAPINDLAEKYSTVQSAFVSTDRIYELLDDNETENSYEGRKDVDIQGTIEFKDVWFAYDDENWVLKGVSFIIPKGARAAFVGTTGAGKTTIINLITRNYTPQKGEILIDGVNVNEISLHTLRSSVSVVLQDVFLFTGNIRENLEMGVAKSDEQLTKALEAAQSKDISFDTAVTEQGLNFSTGERQLISFARAIASEPKVLILDEATAHIDTGTEVKVQTAINEMSKGRTMIYIAHRLSTIRESNIIFVIKNGQIAERGNHNELVALGGEYASLVKHNA